MKNNYPAGRIIPPPAKFDIQQVWHRKLTWKERLQILIGYNLTINLSIKCQYNPGVVEPTMGLLTTTTIIDKSHTP